MMQHGIAGSKSSVDARSRQLLASQLRVQPATTDHVARCSAALANTPSSAIATTAVTLTATASNKI
eukprot:12756-Heterococcus_DN1.PRE.2